MQERALLKKKKKVQGKFLRKPHCVPKSKPSNPTRVNDEVLMVVPLKLFVVVNAYSKVSKSFHQAAATLGSPLCFNNPLPKTHLHI